MFYKRYIQNKQLALHSPLFIFGTFKLFLLLPRPPVHGTVLLASSTYIRTFVIMCMKSYKPFISILKGTIKYKYKKIKFYIQTNVKWKQYINCNIKTSILMLWFTNPQARAKSQKVLWKITVFDVFFSSGRIQYNFFKFLFYK